MISNIEFVKKVYKEQVLALNYFIKECFGALPNKDISCIRFGGGTALAIYYLRHRKSFDIDLFVTDAHVLSYLSPKHWLEDSSFFKHTKYIDQAHHIRVVSKDEIKIDLLVSQDFVKEPLIDGTKELFDSTIYIESIEDIIAKKIIYRKDKNIARDIIDIAVVLSVCPDFLSNLYVSGAIDTRDLEILNMSLAGLDYAVYRDEVEITSPFDEFCETALNAPEIIKKECENILGGYK